MHRADLRHEARQLSQAQRAEAHYRQKYYDSTPADSERVCIHGLEARGELNGRHGVAGPPGPSGLRPVVLEDSGGACVPLRPANLRLAPPRPEDSVYNVGTGAYERRTSGNDGLPHRCRAGSGALSYSSRKRVNPQPPAPPEAGSLLPKPNNPTDFNDAYKSGALPVRMDGGGAGHPLRWLDPMTGAEVARSEVDARRWLPLLLGGLRDTATPGGCYLALRASIELLGAANAKGTLPPLMAIAAPGLRAALELRERSVVCASLKLIQLLLRADGRSGLALRPFFKGLLPSLAAFKLAGQPSLGDEIEISQHRRLNVEDLVDETLALFEASGGEGAGKLIKSFVPSFQPSEALGGEVLHRGFR